MLLGKKSWAGNLHSSLRFASKLYIILNMALNFYASVNIGKRKNSDIYPLFKVTLLWHRRRKKLDDTL